MDPATDPGDRIAGVAALDLPLRRSLYSFVHATDHWVSRDEASDALGISRSLAAFHLDKLVDAGVLEVRYERRTGRTGPGAGRPSKLYRTVGDEVAASIPDRHYDLVGTILAGAVADATRTGTPVAECVRAAARDAGSAIAAEARDEGLSDDAPGRAALPDVLRAHGYEPVEDPSGDIVLANCPFHRLAAEEPELVCGMNLDLLAAVLDGLDPDDTLSARLQPEPGRCCVRISHR